MRLNEAEDLAGRILAAIGPIAAARSVAVAVADQERIESDLAGLRRHSDPDSTWCEPCRYARCGDHDRYATGLLRTARLYDVQR